MTNNITSQKRNITIVYLKALCIICMVFVHAGSGIPFLDRFPYMFHMPLFFFAAGFCFKKKYLGTPLEFLKKRIKGVYWPFVKWGILFLFINNVLNRMHIIDTYYNNWHNYIREAIDILRMYSHPQILGGYWFLPSLFWGSIIAWIIIWTFKKIHIATAVAFIIVIVSNYAQWTIPFMGISTREFLAAFLFIIGYCFADKQIIKFCNWQIISSLTATIIGTFYWRISVSHQFYDNKKLIPYILTAVLSIWALYSIFSKWKETNNCFSKLFIYIGNHTLSILTWHFLCFKLASFIIIKIYELPINKLLETPIMIEYSTKGWWTLYVGLGIFLPLLLTFIAESIVFKKTISSHKLFTRKI